MRSDKVPLISWTLSLGIWLAVVLFWTAVAPGQINNAAAGALTQPAAGQSNPAAQQDILDELTRMSIEQLMNVRVSGVMQQRISPARRIVLSPRKAC